MRLAANIDSNQPEIVVALRQAGASVLCLHMVGHGCPDIAAGFRGVNIFMEIKDGSKVPSKRRLTPDEQKWHTAWNGKVYVVESPAQALAILNTI